MDQRRGIREDRQSLRDALIRYFRTGSENNLDQKSSLKEFNFASEPSWKKAVVAVCLACMSCVENVSAFFVPLN